MEKSVESKYAREFKSFYSLAILNLVFGAIAMALSVALGINNIMRFISQSSPLYLVPALIAFAAFPFTIRWMLAGAEIMDGLDDVKEEHSRTKGKQNSEILIGLIIRLMAQYRAKKQTISKLIFLSKVAATCFIVSGGFILIQTAFNMPSDWSTLATTLAASLINFGIGAAGLYIQHSFKKYSSCWDIRDQKSSLAERQLVALMENM